MGRGGLELADVVRTHRDRLIAYRKGRVSRAEHRVLDDIAACRTAARGGHVEQCNECGHRRIAYNSCRDRHCPKCQERARADWAAQREQELLPVEYFHVVFTLPGEIAEIGLQNKDKVYDLLLRTSAETLRQIAADPAHLGAEIGFLSVLHTWGQDLRHHPHVHCLVPGGGIALEGGHQWIPCRPRFFLSVHVLGRKFRGKFLDHLRRAFDQGKLSFHGKLEHLREPSAFRSYLAPLFEKDWVVYAKPPFAGPEVVLRYLARYANRVAISNTRLLSMVGNKVTFRWKDYRRSGKLRTMKLDAVQFLRRFLLHILPKGFMRIRYYGFMANRCRKQKLERCRELLAVAETVSASSDGVRRGKHPMQCPECQRGTMVCILVLTSMAMGEMIASRSPPDSS